MRADIDYSHIVQDRVGFRTTQGKHYSLVVKNWLCSISKTEC